MKGKVVPTVPAEEAVRHGEFIHAMIPTCGLCQDW